MRELNGANNPNWKGGLYPIDCRSCGKLFFVKNGRKDKAKFCSMKCVGHSQVGRAVPWARSTGRKGPRGPRVPRVERPCKACGKTMLVTPKDVTATCSPE